MASNFPTSLDSFTNPSSTDALDSVSVPHASQHSDLNDAVEALEAKVGVDGSAVTTSIDYRLNTLSYQYVQAVYFTSSGTFTKATYPWLRAIKVTVVGGGGGGGGAAATGSGESSESAGGAGGGHAIKFITDIAGLSASETITVGAGGSGGAAGANDGSNGTASSAFGITGGEGRGGDSMTATSTPAGRFGRESIVGTGGDINGRGDFGGSAFVLSAGGAVGQQNSGGGTILTGSINNPSSNLDGTDAVANTGGGGGGGRNRQGSQSARAGGNGADGIVIVELYA